MDLMQSVEVLIAGAGASGMMAAIMAARQGAKVLLLEKKDRPGKKLLATGNGKCNFTNRRQDLSCYHCADETFADGVLQQFTAEQSIDWFQEEGVLSKERDGYVYPLSGQASTVRNALERAIVREKVRLQCGESILDIVPRYDLTGQKVTGYQVVTDQQKYLARKVILAVGGKAAPVHGSTGDAYDILRKLGVSVVAPLPALTGLELQESCCKEWAGVRVQGTVQLLDGADCVAREQGELQFVAKGISGIPVFQLSGQAARLLSRGRQPKLQMDVLPEYSAEWLEQELRQRLERFAPCSLGDLLEGILPDKLMNAFLQEIHLKKKQGADIVKQAKIRQNLIGQIKQKVLEIDQVYPFEKAQVTTGGVDCHEIDPTTMELKHYPGLYVTGELVDVDGICGGYNLQWAWSSGHLAGICAARKDTVKK